MVSNDKRELFSRVVDIGTRFQSREKIVDSYRTDQLIDLAQEDLPVEGSDPFDVLEKFENQMLQYCVNQSSPKYLAFPDAGNRPEAIAADILVGFLNQNLIADVKSAPIGTYIEIQLIDWMRELVGYETVPDFPASISEVGGAVTFGGVMSNITSLLLARTNLYPDSHANGLSDTRDTYVLVPDIVSHYSIDLAMSYLGFGVESVVRVNLTEEYRMDLDDLETKMADIEALGGDILAVCAYAGDSRTMQIDNFQSIRDLCTDYDTWFHVDACHGGALLFSDRYRHKIDGIDLADSITLDPHKTLLVPYPCSVVLFKDKDALLNVSKNFDMTIKEGSYDLGQITPFIGSKSFESLKLWFLLKTVGIEELGELVDERVELAKYLRKKIIQTDNFVSLHEVNINSQTFIFFPQSMRTIYENTSDSKRAQILDQIDDLNKQIHDKIYDEGFACVHTFELTDEGNKAGLSGTGKRQVLGMILGNPETTRTDIEAIIELLELTGQKILKNSEFMDVAEP